jgi:preprotein translocase subunit Sss1
MIAAAGICINGIVGFLEQLLVLALYQHWVLQRGSGM